MIQKRMIIFINSRGVITWQKSQQKGTKLITLFSRFVKMSNMFTSHPVFTLRSHRIRHLHQHVVLLSLLGLYDSYCARSEMNRKVKKLQTIFVSIFLNYFNSFRRFSVKHLLKCFSTTTASTFLFFLFIISLLCHLRFKIHTFI